jgi:hypothetical protein
MGRIEAACMYDSNRDEYLNNEIPGGGGFHSPPHIFPIRPGTTNLGFVSTLNPIEGVWTLLPNHRQRQ